MKVEKPKGKQCKSHKDKLMKLMQWFEDAADRHRSGQKQIQCPKCKLWFWPDEL